jgi:hypothetical protein
MTNYVIPDDVHAWAVAQVEAGRADTPEAAVAGLVRDHRDLDTFRAALDEARSQPGSRAAPEVLSELRMKYSSS